jgi:hypothetical protein
MTEPESVTDPAENATERIREYMPQCSDKEIAKIIRTAYAAQTQELIERRHFCKTQDAEKDREIGELKAREQRLVGTVKRLVNALDSLLPAFCDGSAEDLLRLYGDEVAHSEDLVQDVKAELVCLLHEKGESMTDKTDADPAVREAMEYLSIALGGNMNTGTLKPLAFAEIMKSYARAREQRLVGTVKRLMNALDSLLPAFYDGSAEDLLRLYHEEGSDDR